MSRLSRTIRHGLRRIPMFDRAMQASKRRERIREWRQAGSPMPPVHALKEHCVLDHATRFGCRVFVETGTFQGDMVEAVRWSFDRVVSIELSAGLHAAAAERFQHVSNVEILQGDSGVVIADVLRELQEPALFWLDAHYSRGETAKGTRATPIASELELILAHPVDGHVVLIDDAREFAEGAEDYPALDEVQAWVEDGRPEWAMEVADDIIRLHLAGSRGA